MSLAEPARPPGERGALPLCETHNLPCDSVCLAETCRDRLKCQICVKKHEHKFYLDDKERDKRVTAIKQEILEKLTFVQTYKKSNILNLRLLEYKAALLKKFEDQELFLESKILEETLNFNLSMQRMRETVGRLIEDTRAAMVAGWDGYYEEAMVHFNCDAEIHQLREHFRELEPVEQAEVEKCVKFLYSDELVFRFNKQFDSLKTKIGHIKRQNQIATDWFEAQQFKSAKVHLCLPEQFRDWAELYQNKPAMQGFEEETTKETRGEIWAGLKDNQDQER